MSSRLPLLPLFAWFMYAALAPSRPPVQLCYLISFLLQSLFRTQYRCRRVLQATKYSHETAYSDQATRITSNPRGSWAHCIYYYWSWWWNPLVLLNIRTRIRRVKTEASRHWQGADRKDPYLSKMNYSRLVLVLIAATISRACITLLDNKWRPHSLETRAAVAQVVVTTRTLSKFAIRSKSRLYGANFEVLSILKGREELRVLLEKGSPSVKEGEKLIVSALGFGDRRHCWSSVDVGETYILFLSINNITGYLVAKYLGAFGAAELYYGPSEDAILLSLGESLFLFQWYIEFHLFVSYVGVMFNLLGKLTWFMLPLSLALSLLMA